MAQFDRNIQSNQPEKDINLWKMFKEGDESAFVEIYQTYANTLFNFGIRYCSDRETVKDCLQDFFIYLRQKRTNLGNVESIKFYLLKSFRRRILDHLKKLEREKLVRSNMGAFSLSVEISDEVKYINRQMEEHNLERLNNSLAKLKGDEREAIYYFFYEGMSYSDIAKLLDLTHVASARRIIYRALGKLRQSLFLIIIFSLISFLII